MNAIRRASYWTAISIAALVLAAGWAQPGLAVEIVGHRGASHDAPENTLASVNLAWKRNADAVEVDVYLSKDGRIVVIHDDTTKRTGGKDKKVVEQTLAELQTLDVGSWKNAKYKNERIPTLSDVLATIPDGKRLFIEIKCGPEIVPELARVLKRAGKKDEQTAVIGFSIEVVDAVKRRLPALKVYWLAALKQDKKTKRWTPTADHLIRRTKRAGLDGIDLGRLDSVDSSFVEKVKKAGLEFYCWTVNSDDEARRLKNIGVDGITTDRPEWLIKKLSPRNTVIKQLISELGSSDYVTRREATRRLKKMGRPAVEPLAEAARSGSLEVIVRAISVLDTIYVTGDDATFDETEQALEKLSLSKNRSIAGRAKRILSNNYDLRERRALSEIARLGGVFKDRSGRAMDVKRLLERLPDSRRIASLSYGNFIVQIGPSWKGGDEGLKQVKRLKRLQHMIFVQNVNNVTKKGLAELAASLPDLRIIERGPAQLGVTGNVGPLDCKIDLVASGSAAEKAGIKRGDVIILFDGKKVDNFDTLVELIALKKPGEKVEIQVRRRPAQIVKLQVVLDGWK